MANIYARGTLEIASAHPFGVPEEHEANARLIASAPELLSALERCERLLSLLNAPGTNDPIESAMFKARAAIARATGKANA